MDLIARGPNGRLDPLAACMLLWSGAVSFDDKSVTWDGERHQLAEPTINHSVVSLYRLTCDDVAQVVPDLLELLDELERDEELRVPAEQLSKDARAALLTGQLLGSTLFLLQSGTHPLIVEVVSKDTLQVRYDERLARGIPRLQDLLCRMLCHLRAFRGDQGSFCVLFKNNEEPGRLHGMDRLEECVDGGVLVLDERVEVGEEELACMPDRTASARDKSEPTDASSLLASSLYTTQVLKSATERRIKSLKETRERIEGDKPQPRTSSIHDPAASGLTSEGKAARSLLVRSLLYLAVGGVLFWAGRMCLMEGDFLLRLLTDAVNQIVGLATDWISLTFGQVGSVGSHEAIELPADTILGALRIAGFALMGLGIVIPVMKILRHKRRLDRERAYTQSHMSFMNELTAQQRLSNEAAYAQELESWSASLNSTSHELELANNALLLLNEAERAAKNALEDTTLAAPQAVSQATKRSAELLVKGIDAEQSEEERNEHIARYCEEAADVVLRARQV